jgi:hypothetical protein
VVTTSTFDADFVARMEAQKPGSRPDHWPLILAEEFAPFRSWLTAQVDLLQDRTRDRTRTRLQSTEFRECTHELAVGTALRLGGWSVEHEPNIEGFTPDWFASGESTTFMVEVASRRVSHVRVRALRAWRRLDDRIRQTASGLLLTVGPGGVVPPNDKEAKQLLDDLRKWVIRPSTDVGSVRTIGRFTFTVRMRHDHLVTMLLAPSEGGPVDKTALTRLIREKASAYESLCQTTGLPLVVALSADPLTGIGGDEFNAFMHGENRHTIVFSFGDVGRPFEQKANFDLPRPGLADVPPHVSAVLWVPDPVVHGRTVVVSNPEAHAPLDLAAVHDLTIAPGVAPTSPILRPIA